MLGAVSVATACLLPNSVTQEIAFVPDGREKKMLIEHPSGSFRTRLVLDDGDPMELERAGVVRTARTLFRGEVYV